MTKVQIKTDIQHTHQRWIKSHPNSTLNDLKEYLEAVMDELLCFCPEDTIADYQDDLSEDALEYLCDWGEGDLADLVMGDDEPATFEYRQGNLEEDIMNVEEAIETLGGSYRLRTR
jgi:putative heme iron utilization protein